ncbi:MAG: aldolase [Rhodospirillales bacterium]|jgi:2-keto-3-deoxy-L-rhamnonate aldolase RhmA|nr:aldolase [Rhodospirillales bacterium]
MPVIENHLRKKLEADEVAIGFSVVHTRGMNIPGIAQECDFDWLFIDMEHNSMDVDAAAQLCVAALPTNVTPLVRVPAHERFHASRVLDGGAMGVIVPHVDTVEEARAVVDHCRFPPLGHRSLTAPSAQLGFATYPTDEAIEILNRNIFVVVMLESPEAIDNADAIAAVDGIDALLIGSNDLAAEMGIPGQLADERITAAFATMCAATKKHGKFAGMGGIYDPPHMAKIINLGVRLVLGGGDVAFMMAAAKQRAQALRAIKV